MSFVDVEPGILDSKRIPDGLVGGGDAKPDPVSAGNFFKTPELPAEPVIGPPALPIVPDPPPFAPSVPPPYPESIKPVLPSEPPEPPEPSEPPAPLTIPKASISMKADLPEFPPQASAAPPAAPTPAPVLQTSTDKTGGAPNADPSFAPVAAGKNPPAPLAAQFIEQTEEPPLLSLARPVPMIGIQPVSKAVPGKPAGDLETLHQLATESYASIESYLVRFKRREQVGGKDMPEELMLFKFRKKPFSVYFKWLAGGAKGREVLYVQGKHGNKLHTIVATGDIPFVVGGKKFSFTLDSPLVRSKSRHSITEAGVGHSIEQFGNLIENMKQKDYRFGSLKYLGLLKRPEFEAPVEAVLHVIPPKVESELPKGGKRFWYFDTKLRFPVLLITVDDKNHEVEYYCYDRWYFPGQFFDDEFNPDVLWREN